MCEQSDEVTRDELIDALEQCIAQACSCMAEDHDLDTWGLRYYADAVDLLARLGRVEIVRRGGRSIHARRVTRCRCNDLSVDDRGVMISLTQELIGEAG